MKEVLKLCFNDNYVGNVLVFGNNFKQQINHTNINYFDPWGVYEQIEGKDMRTMKFRMIIIESVCSVLLPRPGRPYRPRPGSPADRMW